MYIPKEFHETDMEHIRELIEYAPLACIIAHTEQGLLAHHIPIIIENKNKLLGHVALENDIHRMLDENQKILVIFKGVDGYISPNWYPSKAVHHEHVPTWNYQTVHIHGHISFQYDMPSKRRSVSKLTHHFESKTNGDSAWKMGDAPDDYMTNMLENIVACEIVIDRIEATSKLSQNRTPSDRENIIKTLEKRGEVEMASQIGKR